MRFTELSKIIAGFIFITMSAAGVCSAQTGGKKSKTASAPSSSSSSTATAAAKSSAAYAEVLLRKTELEAEIEDLQVEYTDEYPKLKESRYEFGLLGKQLERLASTGDASKLTPALGKLIVRKASLETDLWVLLQKYGEQHDDVKRARRKVAAFEKAIKEILP
jgi:predicted  nucleic acid-binding Zn-ribbon protein